MQVARFWRTKKLRYRLVTMREWKGSAAGKPGRKAGDSSTRDRMPAEKRVRAVS